jgi:hypothetical protein
MTIDYKLLGLLVVLAYTQAGCAGAECNITADRAKYPMSFSRGLPNDTGRTLTVGDGLKVVGSLDIEKTKLGFLYGLTKGSLDISDELNRQVQTKGGEGVVALKLETRGCALNYLFPLMYLPFWPGCLSVQVTGRVVKVSPTAPPPTTSPLTGPPVVAAPTKAPEVVAPARSKPTGKEGTNQ